MLTITFHFDSIEAAAAFLETQGVQPPQVVIPEAVMTPKGDMLVGTEPQPEKKPRKPRADAGKPRGPYKEKAAEAPADAAAPATVPAEKPAAPAAAAPAPTPDVQPTKEITIDDLKAAMTILARKKNIEANMNLLRKFGVGQVSKLPTAHYAAFLAAVKAEAGVA